MVPYKNTGVRMKKTFAWMAAASLTAGLPLSGAEKIGPDTPDAFAQKVNALRQASVATKRTFSGLYFSSFLAHHSKRAELAKRRTVGGY